ncbi:MAG: hypothetical protein IJ053_05465 [Lachnospiraceae bacterium]|nr:hypothetical protein [Lachnospiraceae bacterium]
MLGDENNSDKSKIDDTILNILKGNVNAVDAINEEVENQRQASFFSFDDDYVDETDYEAEYEASHAEELREFAAKQEKERKASEKEAYDRQAEYGFDNRESNYGHGSEDFKVELGAREEFSNPDYADEYGAEDETEQPSLGLNIDFGSGFRDDFDDGESGFKISLAKDNDSSGGRKLGEPEPGTGGRLGKQLLNAWDYRTLPNKMLELVKNMGNMKQEGTGYFADSESEMLTVLAYLNYGETTGTTESMREQIDEACKNLENRVLLERDDADRYK